MAVVVGEWVLDDECCMDELTDGDETSLGTPDGTPVPLLQPAASTSTAAAEIEKRTKRLFMMNLS
jgi:hypothetical protein